MTRTFNVVLFKTTLEMLKEDTTTLLFINMIITRFIQIFLRKYQLYAMIVLKNIFLPHSTFKLVLNYKYFQKIYLHFKF